MNILSIETSCDETAISLIDTRKEGAGFSFKILGNALASQAALHAKYGGVFPMMAKREHGKNLVPLLIRVLKEAKMLNRLIPLIRANKGYKLLMENKLKKVLEREPELLTQFLKKVPALKKPKIDLIAVTSGPGLEPALWVGINFAKALSLLWNIPVVPINHMEGHLFAGLLQTAERRRLDAELRGKNTLIAKSYKLRVPQFPLLALLISGGHTELVMAKKIGSYKVIGETRDDAVGEAFDKVARMLGLSYPGGPQISALAEFARTHAEQTPKAAEGTWHQPASILRNSASSLRVSARQPVLGSLASKYRLPRPMINSNNFDFSFSGLKTAVLYMLRKIKRITPQDKRDIAREFEDSVTEVLVSKTLRAVKKYEVKTLVIGGGVSANKKIRAEFSKRIKNDFPKVKLFLPDQKLTTDNALMIAVAGYFGKNRAIKKPSGIRADGNLRLGA